MAAGDPRLSALDSGWARGLIGLNKAVGALVYTRAHVHVHMHMHMHMSHAHVHVHVMYVDV